MHQQSFGHCVLFLLIISLPNKSGENAPELLYHSSTERYGKTTYLINSPRNQSVQTFRETSRENSTRSNIREDSTSTSREEFEEEDEFAQRNVTKNGGGQAYANETRMAGVIPKKFKDGIYFKILPRNSSTENKNHNFQLCCPLGHRLCLKEKKCIADDNFIFPQTHEIDKDVFNFSVDLVWNQEPLQSLCNDMYSPYMIDPVILPDNEYNFVHEQVYFPRKDIAYPLTFFCVAAVNQTGFDLITCKLIMQKTPMTIAIIVSSIFLLITFVVYSVLREFRNMHSYLLRAYIASDFVSKAIFVVYLQVQDTMDYSLCASLSFMYHFAIYSVSLWQNVTCFDIWLTFRGFRRLHKKEEKPNRLRKTFVFYSLFVWGVSFVATIVVIIMDFVPNIPDYLIKPNMCKLIVDTPVFWLSTTEAKMIYLNLCICITWICNTYLFVWTAVKILYDKKRINCQMKNSESRRHNDRNKKSFWMYLKLCVAMSINWIPVRLTLELIWIIYDLDSNYMFLSIANYIISLDGIIIFIMFVCTKNVIRLLMKRFTRCGY